MRWRCRQRCTRHRKPPTARRPRMRAPPATASSTSLRIASLVSPGTLGPSGDVRPSRLFPAAQPARSPAPPSPRQLCKLALASSSCQLRSALGVPASKKTQPARLFDVRRIVMIVETSTPHLRAASDWYLPTHHRQEISHFVSGDSTFALRRPFNSDIHSSSRLAEDCQHGHFAWTLRRTQTNRGCVERFAQGGSLARCCWWPSR